MSYRLAPSTDEDEAWREHLRRVVDREVLDPTCVRWDAARHEQQFRAGWHRGRITIIEADGLKVGMIQLCERPDGMEVGEMQILPSHQNRGIGSQVLRDIIARVHQQRRKVFLSVALKNVRAYRLYQS